MANIFSQYAQPVRSIQDYQASYDAQDLRREQLGAAKRTNALADLTAEQTRQTMADGQRSQNIIRQVYSGFDPSAGPDALYSALERTGDRAAIDLAGVKRKEAMERRKGESEAGAKDVETENKVIITYRDLIGNAANPQQAAQYVQIMHADPRLKGTAIARVPLDQALSQIGSDPQTFNQWKQQFALGAAKFVEMNKPTYQQQNLGGTMQTLALPGLGGAPTVAASAPITQSADNRATNETSRSNNQASVGATLAGQRSAAETARLGRVQADEHFKETGVRAAAKDAADRADGSKATEGERNASGYASRMTEATKLLDKFEKTGRGTYSTEIAAGVPFVGGAMRTAVSSSDQQQYRQAQEDWVRAKLRKESGASIATDEMDREISTYFPQPGEGSAVIEQKRRARAVATEGMSKAAGRAGYASAVPAAAPSKTASGATASNW